jgi:hypothetical protein
MQMVFNLSHSFFLLFDYLLYEKFEDTKGYSESEEEQTIQWPKEKGQAMIYGDN